MLEVVNVGTALIGYRMISSHSPYLLDTDPSLTSVTNQGSFDEYVNALYPWGDATAYE